MTRTLLYFGSYNPVHIGHLAIANYALAIGAADELWFVVSPQNPFKIDEYLVPELHRLKMVEIAIRNTGLENRIFPCGIELDLPKPSYTIRTLEKLRSDYPERYFSILMGEDNLGGFANWKDSETIGRNHRIFIYGRSGSQTDSRKIPLTNLIFLENAPYLDISSTMIRNLLTQGKSIPALLPPGVYNYIIEENLYGSKH